jgi:hypothetical protein
MNPQESMTSLNPEGMIQRCNLDARISPRRRVNELAVRNRHPDMSEIREEEEIAGPD